MKFTPGYRSLVSSGELGRLALALVDRLGHCDLCPWRCGVDRLRGHDGYCGGGRWAAVSSACDHHGEEPALSGKAGSGTIFLGGCNLRCVYCQNHQISQPVLGEAGVEVDASELANKMLALQDKGCHNINWVSPSHFVAQLVEALVLAAERGLDIPVVYNTNAYDSLDTLKLLKGVVDIYLPDIKYSSDIFAEKYSQAVNYVAVSRSAIREMYRQVGDLVVGEDEVAHQGLIVRHLILPNGLAGSRSSLEWVSGELSPDVTLSIMAQYYPGHKAARYQELNRPISQGEYDEVTELLERFGLENGWLQEMSATGNYQPDFSREGHPFEPSREG